MSEHESFEDRLRAMADQVSQSVQRMSEVDLEELAESYGVDAQRARGFAEAAGQWLSAHLASGEPLFGQAQRYNDPRAAAGANADHAATEAPGGNPSPSSANPGPHPLDLPTGRQGLALAALDSGRWTVRPGSNQLAGTGEGAPPADSPDLVGDLRARDWITADGTPTLVGRQALTRWCRSAENRTDLGEGATPVRDT